MQAAPPAGGERTTGAAVQATASTRQIPQRGQVIRTAESATDTAEAAASESPVKDVLLTWPHVAGAVQYQVVLLRTDSPSHEPDNLVYTMDNVNTNGCDMPLSHFGTAARSFYWQVCALDRYGHALGKFSTPQPVSAGRFNMTAPEPNTEFDKMDYMMTYPVFAWIPQQGAWHHEVQVFRRKMLRDDLIRTLSADEYMVYENGGYTVPGRYFWRVRAVTADGEPLSDWSRKTEFEVKAPCPFAALGDSITHGGGAMSVSGASLIYDWETYSEVPVKNIGFSGDTTQAMLNRFETDVLPFSPSVLVIMGGVNDYRGGTMGSQTVQNLIAIRDKCLTYGIVPVFLTVTPINPAYIAQSADIETPPSDWQAHRAYINNWIMVQRYHIDTASALTDDQGWLRSDYTTDGLHPDYMGKKLIGEKVGRYLKDNFPWLLDRTPGKKPIPKYASSCADW